MKPEFGEMILVNGRRYKVVGQNVNGDIRLEGEGDDYLMASLSELVFDSIPSFKLVRQEVEL